MVLGLGWVCSLSLAPRTSGKNAQSPTLNIKFVLLQSPSATQSRSRSATRGTVRRPCLQLGGRAMSYSCLQPEPRPTDKKEGIKRKRKYSVGGKSPSDSRKQIVTSPRVWDAEGNRGLAGAKVSRQVTCYISNQCCSAERGLGKGEITWKDENRTCASDDPIRCEVLQEIHI